MDDLAGYPIHFRSMRFAFTSDNPVGPNKIQIKEMMMVYDYMTVGFDRQEKAERFSVYPNPAKGEAFLNIQTDRRSSVNLRIYTTSGRQVAYRNYGICDGRNLALPTNGLDNGTYLVKITVDGETETIKLIIHH